MFSVCTAICCLAALGTTPVDLRLELLEDPVGEGGTIRVALIAATADAGTMQDVAALDVVLNWDPLVIGLVETDSSGAFPWISSGFMANLDGLNDDLDDGDAVLTALASPSAPAVVSSSGLLVATLEFAAIAPADATPIEIVLQQGEHSRTRVLAPSPPQTDVLDSVSGTEVTIRACGTGDWDGDGEVDLADFAGFQTCYSGAEVSAAPFCACLFDVEPDDDVDLGDYIEFAQQLTGPLP
jgi:hypothetical protein